MMPGSHLCLVERVEIQSRLERGESFRAIGDALGRRASTISREVRRCDGDYQAVTADEAATRRRRRHRVRLLEDPQLAQLVRQRLVGGWSPAPIAAWLKTKGHRICAETIYQECYRPNSALGTDAWQLLARSRPSKRRRRRTRSGVDRQPLGAYRPITQRPTIETPGHWEGDLIVGAQNRSAAVVITERHSRYTLIGALTNQTAPHVAQVVTQLLETIPPPLRRTLTWDQGRELAHWPRIEAATGIEVFFCRPRSPWEKPLVENTCGLLRRWLPRKSNLYRTQHELNHIAHQLNTMPRRIHHWNTAQTRYDQLRVATTS